MSQELARKRVAFLTANEGVERVELTEPWSAIQEAGGVATLVGLKVGTVQTFDHLDPSETFEATTSARQAIADDYDALVLPGGVANPDQLRLAAAAVGFARAFFDAGKPVAVICHGPWTLIEADVVRDRSLTSWPSLRTDIENAGGRWVDEEVVVCDQGPNVLVSSRKPDDLPAFIEKMTKAIAG